MKLFGDKRSNGHKESSSVNNGNNINSNKNGKNKKKHKAKPWFIALAVIAALFLSAIAYWVITTKAPEIATPNIPEGEIVNVSSKGRRAGVYTLLVVGNDQEGYNTDTIMVLSYDSNNKTASAASIPRDTMVNVESESKKINAVYQYGGMENLLDAVEGIVGFRPDNYIMVDTGCFIDVIDAMGGLYFDVPQDMEYEDFSDHDKDGIFEYVFQINVEKGYQLLNGYDALGVYRYREGYAMGDIQRLEVQHNLIMAAAEQFMSTRNIFKLYQVASILSDNAETDLSYGNLQWYAQQFLGLSMENISVSSMPTTGAYVNITSYVLINVDEWIEMLNSKINPMNEEIDREDCSILYWTNPSAPIDGQFRVEPRDLATTDGSKVYTNFQ